MKNQVYSKALDHIYEYMGIENIIKRLQDVDKLKMVLIDKNQRKIFEHLPKPGITKKPSSTDIPFSIESVVMSKKESNQNSIEPYQKLNFNHEKDQFGKRLLEMIDTSKTLENIVNKGLLSIFAKITDQFI